MTAFFPGKKVEVNRQSKCYAPFATSLIQVPIILSEELTVTEKRGKKMIDVIELILSGIWAGLEITATFIISFFNGLF